MRFADTGSRFSGIFAALRHHDFRLLFAGLVAANLGSWMQQFALGWLVVQLAVRDGNPALAGFYLGLISLARAVPGLAFGLIAGVYADRMDRRNLLITARIASSVLSVVLAVMVITDRANIINVMLVSAATAAAFAFDPPGRQAILTNVVPRGDLFSAMGLMRGSMQLAHTFGPLIAGLLIVPIGVGGVMAAKAALVMASVGALLPMKAQPVEPAARAMSVLGSLREGLSYVRRDDLIRWTVILHLVFAVLAQSFMQLLPAVAVDTLRVGAVELSWLTGAVGVGALVGAFFVASLGSIVHRGLLLIGTMFSVGVMLVVLGIQREIVGTLAVLGVLGVLQQLFLGTQSVILQLAAPDRLRGRVMGMQSVIFNSCGPLGVFAVGTLGTFIGVSTAIALAGAAAAVLAVLVVLRVEVIRDHRAGGDQVTAPRAAAIALSAEAEGSD
jgi:MFS family permease